MEQANIQNEPVRQPTRRNSNKTNQFQFQRKDFKIDNKINFELQEKKDEMKRMWRRALKEVG